jgi:site-specific DNA-methyltransferase (adenine-specific)
LAQGIELTEIPRMARDDTAASKLFDQQSRLPSWHRIYRGDSRNLEVVKDDTIHLIVTSPPYWTLKEYPEIEGQLGRTKDYAQFLEELRKVIRECYRVLIPGGRLVCVVGDVLLSRKKAKRHVVYPLHSDITIICRNAGFENLTPILWYKITNAKFEANSHSTILGKPYEPNAVIKSDTEFILIQRKPGPYRKPSIEQRKLSYIPRRYYESWFRQIWDLHGESTRRHPAPFPLELATRLVRMYSFVGDVVLDPFLGTGTTSLAALKCGRNSVGFEIDPHYARMARDRVASEGVTLVSSAKVEFSDLSTPTAAPP